MLAEYFMKMIFFFSIKMTDVDEFEDTLDASRRSSENEVSIVNFC